MEIKVSKISKEQKETIWIQCYEITPEVHSIVRFVKSIQGTITGIEEDREQEICIPDILYIESVDDKTYIYTKNHVYSSKCRLYELENQLENKSFIRISKSCVINLMKIVSIKPALNGRFSALLTNNEEVIISRKYVPTLKEKIRGGRSK